MRTSRFWLAADDAPTDRSLLVIDDERIRLVGLRQLGETRMVLRFVSTEPDGITGTIALPPGTTAATESTYLGEAVRSLELSDGRVELTFTGSGARAITIQLA